MQRYNIGGIHLGVSWENEDGKNRNCRYHDCVVLPRALEAFHTRAVSAEPDMEVSVMSLSGFSGSGKSKRVYNQSFRQADGKMTMTVYDPFDLKVPGYSIVMSKDYSRVKYIPHLQAYEHYDLQWLMHPFEGKALYKGGMVLHGAAVEYGGKGVLFTGTSGAGKSTQAHLWRKHREALIINGDSPLIRTIDGMPKMFGTPWSGSSGESVNRSVPLDAIVYVRQGTENALSELTGNEAFLAVLANVNRSNFDNDSTDLAIENLKRIIHSLRVFDFTCTKNVESVEFLEKKIL